MKEIIQERSEIRLDTLRHVFGIDRYKRIKENSQILTQKIKEAVKVKESQVSEINLLKEKLSQQTESKIQLTRQTNNLDLEFKDLKIKKQQAEEKLSSVREGKQQKQLLDSALATSQASLQGKKDISQRLQKEITSMQIQIKQKIDFSPEQLKEAFEYLASVTPENQNYAIPDPLFRTYVNGRGVVRGSPSGKIAFRIRSDGEVVPNVFTDQVAGNVFTSELSEIIQGKVFLQYQRRNPTDKCADCASYDNCEGGDKTDSYLIKGDMDAPDPYCFLDTEKRNDFRPIKFEDTRFVHETYLGTIYVPIKNG